MNGSIRLVRPTAAHKTQALAFLEEFFSHNEPVIFGSELLDKAERYEARLPEKGLCLADAGAAHSTGQGGRSK